MKTDTYTKTVLTIIAICLAILTFQHVDIIPKAYAATPGDYDRGKPFDSGKYMLVPVNADGSINVNIIKGDELDVNIKSISTNDELDVNIDEVGGFPTMGTVPVKMK
jgi:hypothetical protein